MKQALEQISEDSIPIAYEDRFFVVGVGESDSLAPHADTAHALGTLVSSHLNTCSGAEVVFDLRGLSQVYNDVHDFLYCVTEGAAPLLASFTATRYSLSTPFKRTRARSESYRTTQVRSMNCHILARTIFSWVVHLSLPQRQARFCLMRLDRSKP